MARVSAEEYAEKWGRRLSGATEDIRRGVERVQEAPGRAAARQKDAMIANLLQALNDGTWEAQVSKVTVEEWKDSTIRKGLQRIATGVEQAKPNQVAMAQRLLAAVDASVAEVNRTPRGDLEANINRMVTFARGMHSRKLRRPGAR